MKYYEEEIELNDICHFRIETSLSDPNPELILTANLMFVDLSTKKTFEKMDVNNINIQMQEKEQLPKEAKLAKTKKFHVRKLIEGIHEFVPLVF